MELRHLRYFAAVAEHLNYSEASRRLHVAQPAISQTILDLEEEIGAKLFLRSNRNVQLTAAGTVLLEEVQSILKRADDAKRAAQRAARGEVGVLRMGFIAPATALIMPPLVQAYRDRFPDVELQLQHMNPDAQIAAFDEGMLDLGFSRPLLPEQRPYFGEEMIYRDYLVAALPPKHVLAKERKIQLQKLATEPFVLFHRVGAPGLFDEAVGICLQAGFSPNVRHETDLMTTVFLLVESGLGVSLVPSCARGLEGQKIIRRPLTVRSNPLCLCAIWPRGSQSPTVEAFLHILRSQIPTIRKQVALICSEPSL
ncbi:MAG: LysR family transcriptional regulator [Verrucomicrobia bacterium]|nr:LysR family transcriptional regulator [Verrucomicrobiota bacterium]